MKARGFKEGGIRMGCGMLILLFSMGWSVVNGHGEEKKGKEQPSTVRQKLDDKLKGVDPAVRGRMDKLFEDKLTGLKKFGMDQPMGKKMFDRIAKEIANKMHKEWISSKNMGPESLRQDVRAAFKAAGMSSGKIKLALDTAKLAKKQVVVNSKGIFAGSANKTHSVTWLNGKYGSQKLTPMGKTSTGQQRYLGRDGKTFVTTGGVGRTGSAVGTIARNSSNPTLCCLGAGLPPKNQNPTKSSSSKLIFLPIMPRASD